MKLTIIKNLSWRKVYLVFLSEDRKEVKEELIKFDKDNKVVVDIDLNQVKYCYYTDKVRKSEMIVLSENLDCITIYYNKRSRFYTMDLSIENHEDYGHVDTYILDDKKNLFFRKDHKKKINVWTPSSYDKNKTYKVVIMFDAQNIFSLDKVGRYTKNNDRYGGWQVDVTLENIKNRYHEDYIVLALDNSDKYRMNELMPNEENWSYRPEVLCLLDENTPNHFDNFINFIMETALPFVESKYQVDTNDMVICGSSCGGSASIYMGLKVPNRFKYILTFTPAIGWMDDEHCIELYTKYYKAHNKAPYIFFFQGDNEECELEQQLCLANTNFVSNLVKAGIPQDHIEVYYEPTAWHNEDPWRYAFNYAMEWVQKNK